MKPALSDFSHILLIQTAFIGDTTLTLFVASAIKQLHPHSSISIVCTPVCASLMSASKDIDNVFSFDKRTSQKSLRSIYSLAKQLSTQNVDCIINLHASFRSALLALLTKATYRVCYSQSALSWLYSASIPRPQFGSERDKQLSILQAFSSVTIPNYSALLFERSNESNVLVFLEKNSLQYKDFVVIAPNSVWREKRWKLESFKQLCSKLLNANIPIVIIGADSDRTYCEPILTIPKVIDAVGILTIPESVALIHHARVIVSNDSAPIHFASVVNTPTIAIFGPTIPAYGFAPLAEDSVVLENNNLPCRPCSHNGSKPCKYGTSECMTSISVSSVVTKVLSFFPEMQPNLGNYQ
jgi:heptosyltransferase-2